MDKENVVHIMKYYSAVKKSEVTKSASKWVELENTNLVKSPRPVPETACSLSSAVPGFQAFVLCAEARKLERGH